jgi:mRNA interferase MazF
MEKPLKGCVVIVPFPFTDLSGSKLRPALVIADLPGEDIILCQITSQGAKDNFAVPFALADFDSGGLSIPGNIRPNRIFTAETSIVVRIAGTINPDLHKQVVDKIIDIVRQG